MADIDVKAVRNPDTVTRAILGCLPTEVRESPNKTFGVLKLTTQSKGEEKTVYFVSVSGFDMNPLLGKCTGDETFEQPLQDEFFSELEERVVVCPCETKREIYAGMTFPELNFWNESPKKRQEFRSELRKRLNILAPTSIFPETRGHFERRMNALDNLFDNAYHSRFLKELYRDQADFNKYKKTMKHLWDPFNRDATIEFLRKYKKPTRQVAEEYLKRPQVQYALDLYANPLSPPVIDNKEELLTRIKSQPGRLSSDEITKCLEAIREYLEPLPPDVYATANYFCRCAEDNAVIAMIAYLGKDEPSFPPDKIKIRWYSATYGIPKAKKVKEGAEKKFIRKPLCGICDLVFVVRTKKLLEAL